MSVLKYVFATLILLSVHAEATIIRVVNNAVAPQTVNAIKVFYTGVVNQEKVMALASVIDEINQKYTSAKHIYLYISSTGGDVDSGNIGYQLVKSSPIPVTTINVSFVQSSATLMYCGAQNRLVMDNTEFLLHAPTVGTVIKNDVSENVINDEHEWSATYRGMIKHIYKICTNLSDDKIDKLTYSEDNHMLLNSTAALNIKLATGEQKGIQPTEASFYIYDGSKAVR
ncbi:ATP-dependent Clp protease proteolytic subunit [Acerihabitans sp. TG2]|uniref:ATP-dependent Clp protease proteolytic subunit n=1 Tax=Acerihabitans sp. TG2 TaxID=3096008 RepID=UPI002B239CC4|nr:ATP-dependent Clp protease proteolytic subunit [Acerihabitans sp. TG2]MEA9391221.1 ATP-dependent Clp protease proteolytic subunit [Acerihabitans sp. TG2]